MKINELIAKIWAVRSKIREVSNVIIRVIDAIDGHQDWVPKKDLENHKDKGVQGKK